MVHPIEPLQRRNDVVRDIGDSREVLIMSCFSNTIQEEVASAHCKNGLVFLSLGDGGSMLPTSKLQLKL